MSENKNKKKHKHIYNNIKEVSCGRCNLCPGHSMPVCKCGKVERV